MPRDPSTDPALASALADLATNDPQLQSAARDLIRLAFKTFTRAMTQGTLTDQLRAASLFVKPVMQSLSTNEGDAETRAMRDEMRGMMEEMRGELKGGQEDGQTGARADDGDGPGAKVIGLPIRDTN